MYSLHRCPYSSAGRAATCNKCTMENNKKDVDGLYAQARSFEKASGKCFKKHIQPGRMEAFALQ